MSYTIEIDEDACSAHGDCADLAPEVFELDDVARVIGTGPDELVLAAAEICPSSSPAAAFRSVRSVVLRPMQPLDFDRSYRSG